YRCKLKCSNEPRPAVPAGTPSRPLSGQRRPLNRQYRSGRLRGSARIWRRAAPGFQRSTPRSRHCPPRFPQNPRGDNKHRVLRESARRTTMEISRYHKLRIGNHRLRAETLMLGYGYDPALSEGSAKPPVFLTSTFVFRTAEEGRDFFDYTAGRREPPAEGRSGLVYSRFNHPNLEIIEDRLAVYEGAEEGLVFSSGMAAITTAILCYVRPGDVVLHSRPLYGGTEILIEKTLTSLGIEAEG